MILGKLSFGKDRSQFGLELCLARAGMRAYPVTPETVAAVDVLLVSMFWYRDVYALESFLRRAGIGKGSGKPWILAGGMQATMTPEIIARMVDWVFIGDADDHLGPVLREIEERGECAHPSIYAADGRPVPEPACCAPTAFSVETLEKAGVMRVEIARGCKYKCAFCALTGLKPYREVPYSDLEPLILKAGGRRCSFFAPERTAHSDWARIKSEMRLNGCHDIGQDARLENLGQIDGSSVTFGLEGISRRLRKSIGKGFTDKMILDRLGDFVRTRKNIARVSAYFIADLPGENDADWAEVAELFAKIEAEDWSRRLVLVPVLNPLSPKRFTPLEHARIHLFADYESRWLKLLRRDGGQWGFRVVETLVWGPLERTMDALVQRGGPAAYQIVQRMPQKLLDGKPPKCDRGYVARATIALAGCLGISQAQLEGETAQPPILDHADRPISRRTTL